MRLAGAPQDVIEQVVTQNNGAPEIQPANLITVRLFFACATQWNHAGMSGTRTGLNYGAVDVRAAKIPEYQALDLDDQEWVWDGLQKMEAEALKVWQDKD